MDATLISKGKQQSYSVHPGAQCFHVDDGGVLILTTPGDLDMLSRWIEENGISGIYFDSFGEAEQYNEFIYVSVEGNNVGIRLYK